MLSFIIPTYNYVCVRLAADLTEQAEALHRQMPQAFDYEVLVGDDASTDKATVDANRAINNLPHARLIEMEHNMGRAFLLNRLMEEARFDHVVMIDSDAAVCTPDFVSRYWHAREEASVLCGTLRNPDTPVQPGCELRYKYEHAATTLRQQQAAENMSPYLRLSTFNLMLGKRALGDGRGLPHQDGGGQAHPLAFGRAHAGTSGPVALLPPLTSRRVGQTGRLVLPPVASAAAKQPPEPPSQPAHLPTLQTGLLCQPKIGGRGQAHPCREHTLRQLPSPLP